MLTPKPYNASTSVISFSALESCPSGVVVIVLVRGLDSPDPDFDFLLARVLMGEYAESCSVSNSRGRCSE